LTVAVLPFPNMQNKRALRVLEWVNLDDGSGFQPALMGIF